MNNSRSRFARSNAPHSSTRRRWFPTDDAIATLNFARFVLPEYPVGLRQATVTAGNVIVVLAN